MAGTLVAIRVAYLALLSLFLSGTGFAGPFGGRVPFRQNLPPHSGFLPPPTPQQQQQQQQQQRYGDGAHTNNVSPYYNAYGREWQDEEDSEGREQNGQPVYIEHNLYGDTRPSGPLRGNEPGFSPDTPTWRTQVQSTPPDLEPECEIVGHYKGSVPRGLLKDLTVTPLRSTTARECLDKCCELGPRKCPYIWVFGNKCLAVSCPLESPELCEPRAVSDDDMVKETGYYRVSHPLEHNLKTEFEAEATQATTPSMIDDITITSPTEGNSPTGDDIIDTPTEGTAPIDRTDTTPRPPSESDETDREETEQGESSATDHEQSTVGNSDNHHHDNEEEEKEGETTDEHPTVNHTPDTITTDTTQTPPSLEEPHKHLENLTIAVSSSTDEVLPDGQVQLFASSWPDPPGVRYHWSQVSGPKEGVLSGMNDASVTLSELLPGIYGLKVTAQAPNGQYGEKYVNVTVHERPRDNTPPQAIVSPSNNYTIVLPQDTVIFDASQTVDDKGPENLSFQWQQVAGPMGTTAESNEALLTLTNPQPGQYRYKLTVTDSDGAVNVSFVDLKVSPEPDYLPLANAGSDVVLKLPNTEVILNGNKSSDDKPGLKFLWEMTSEQTGVDMEGTDTPTLRVSKLRVGVYIFKLTVTDSAGQTDFSEVTVDVLPENNVAPVADAGGHYQVTYPDTSTVLDGSHSRDDYEKGMKYSWKLTSGPVDITLSGTNTSHLSVSGLHIDPDQGSPTIFTFNLTITDYGNLSSTDTAELEFRKDPKTLPHVSAGPDVTITLPQNTAVLNGSATWDDFGITSYQWSRSNRSPAAGIPLLDSDTTPVLILSDLVNGTYNFTLHVTNRQGMSASDTMQLHVLANPHDHYIIQLHLNTDISNFSRADLKDLGKYLSLTLDDNLIQFQGVYEAHPHTVVEFYAVDPDTNVFMNVSDAWKKLTENGQDYHVLHYHIVHVDMKECQLPCSGHGKCDRRTKRCHCDVFWMENPFTANTGRQESNCEWSVFYVVLVVIGFLFAIGISIWLACWCCCRRRSLARTKRRIRYAIHDHNEDGESKRMLTKERLGYQESSLMQSESETEEEVLFDTSKKHRSSSPQIKNNKLNSERYGKNSSLVNTVIPK